MSDFRDVLAGTCWRRQRRDAQAPTPSSGGTDVMRDEQKQEKTVDRKLMEKNMKRINREIELSLFFLKHGCPG
jgi:hypothetical protein